MCAGGALRPHTAVRRGLRSLASRALGDDNSLVSAGAEPEPRVSGIDAAAWHGLLAFLARGGGDGGPAYEELHHRLVVYFDWKGCAGARELADETLNRVAQKLAAGETIETDEPARYAFGVARFVYLEAVKRGDRHATADTPGAGVRDPAVQDEAVQREADLAALEACLDAMPAQTRALLLRYHEDDGRQRIDHRKRLADELGIALNALRIRMHRVRAQLEDCVRRRLTRSTR